jgi:general secretion pathway protein E
MISRIKVLADLDITERRLPQDGRIRFGVSGREIDLRIATMPHIDGEGAVLRILDRSSVTLDLASLGFDTKIRSELSSLLSAPHGIFLVTGPTGSGKTTTLYAALRQLAKPELNVVSVEDPVEYHLTGVNQIQVNRKIGFDFATALRAILRQDPDIIMVGEIRDAETAMIANQAALTGHFVLATLHTNTAAASIPRLIDMGIEPYLLASTMRGALSQRLVRLLCDQCAEPISRRQSPVSVSVIRIAERAGLTISTDGIRRPVGCQKCNGSGYAGRAAIAELVVVDDPLREAIARKADTTSIEANVRSLGRGSLVEAGLAQMCAGRTSAEELIRVLGEGALQ